MASPQDTSIKYSQIQYAAEDSARCENKGPRSQHWKFEQNRSFFWMVVSLLSGIAISAGHHFFYNRFHGLRVDEVQISQTWIIRIGTIFAFVAKTLLVVAVSIAFVQQQWLAFSFHKFKIRQIDTITGVLSNALCFLESRVWFQFPLLAVMAGVAWLLPIAAIITPAAIIVVTKENVFTAQGDPPQLYFDPNTYASLATLIRSEYIGPSPDTLRAAFGTAMTGQILNIEQKQPNMGYTLDFLGPALRCDHADDALISEVFTSYMQDISGGGMSYHYFAWVPSIGSPGNLSLAIGNPIKTLDLVSTDAAHLFVIPNTALPGPFFEGDDRIGPNDHYGYQDLLDCKLYNASYRANFNLTFPTQSINIEYRELLNPVSVWRDITDWLYRKGPVDTVAQRICYQSIMDSFGRLLAGYEYRRDNLAFTMWTSWNMMSIDWRTRDGTQKGLELLFQNITLSMLGTSSLIMNSTIAARNTVPVDIHTSVNLYSYSSKDLWRAYGIACGAAILSTILGIYGIWRNGGVGYQSQFSTFIRTTRNPILTDLIDPDDHGTEPLPKNLAEVRIILDTQVR